MPRLAACAFTLAAAPLNAGPPFTTNDADPPAVGQWELILPFTLGRSRDGSLGGEFTTFDINYGFDAFTQLSIEVPVAYSRPRGERLRWGAGDVLLEYKRRFGTDQARGYFGINPEVTLPSGDEERGLGAGRVTVELPLLYEKRWGQTFFYADVRYKWRAGDAGKSFWFFGAVVERQLTKRLEIGAELFATTPTEFGGEPAAGFNAGFKYALHEHAELLVSGGRDLRGDTKLALFLGIAVFFP